MDPAERLRRIDAEIDRVWFAKWEQEEAIFNIHNEPERVVAWVSISLGALEPGTMVYRAPGDCVGSVIAHGTRPAKRKKPAWDWTEVQHPHKARRYDRTIGVYLPQSSTPPREACDCETCEAVRERRQFLAQRKDTTDGRGQEPIE